MIPALAIAASLLNPAVSDRTLDQTVCRPGWTKTIRPSTAYIRNWERRHLPPGQDPRLFIVDHRVSLGIGGNPYAPNLKLQTVAEAARKDVLERRLNRLLCGGRISLERAQEIMLERWP